MLQTIEFDLPGVILIIRPKYLDERGSFLELYNDEISSFLGEVQFAQENISYSKNGVIRGMHWQEEPFSQAKLVTCLSGKIKDVVLAIDSESPQFGEHLEVILDSPDKSLWIPRGYAHGFESLSDNTIVNYKVDQVRNPNFERRLNPLSTNLKQLWTHPNPIISSADLSGDFFKP